MTRHSSNHRFKTGLDKAGRRNTRRWRRRDVREAPDTNISLIKLSLSSIPRLSLSSRTTQRPPGRVSRKEVAAPTIPTRTGHKQKTSGCKDAGTTKESEGTIRAAGWLVRPQLTVFSPLNSIRKQGFGIPVS